MKNKGAWVGVLSAMVIVVNYVSVIGWLSDYKQVVWITGAVMFTLSFGFWVTFYWKKWSEAFLSHAFLISLCIFLMLVSIFVHTRFSSAKNHTDDLYVNERVRTALEDSLVAAANGGSVGAQMVLGHLYYLGKGICEMDQEQARKWFTKARNAGDKEALSMVYKMTYYGFGGSIDEEEARYFAGLAAEKGDYEARTNVVLGMEVDLHMGLIRTEEHKELFREAAENGSADHQAIYAQYLLVMEGNETEAEKWFKECVKAGQGMSAYANYLLYIDVRNALRIAMEEKETNPVWSYYLQGRVHEYSGFPGRDFRKAIRYFRQGATLGNDACKKALIDLLTRETAETDPDFREAIAWCDQLDMSNFAQKEERAKVMWKKNKYETADRVQVLHGKVYDSAHGHKEMVLWREKENLSRIEFHMGLVQTEKDKERLRKSAENELSGHQAVYAQYLLVIEGNETEAEKWFKESLKGGERVMSVYTNYLLYKGVQKSLQIAMEERDTNPVWSYYLQGKVHECDEFSGRDFRKAMGFFYQGALLGNDECKIALIDLLSRKTVETDPDFQQALAWCEQLNEKDLVKEKAKVTERKKQFEQADNVQVLQGKLYSEASGHAEIMTWHHK